VGFKVSDEFARNVAKGMEVDKQRSKAAPFENMLQFMNLKSTSKGKSMNKSESIVNLAKAMVLVQSEIKGAVKDAANPFYKSKYANLESVWEACRLPLTKNGFSVIQTTEGGADGEFLITTLLHSSGEWMEGRYRLTPVKNDPQAVGSALTYARRYSLAAMVGVVQCDDDAESAMDRPTIPVIDRTPNPPQVAPKVQPRPSYDEPVQDSGSFHAIGGVMATLTEGARLEAESAEFNPYHCEGCGTALIRTSKTAKNAGWYCPNFKKQPDVQHSFVRD
jgi:hypothetical protein